MARNENVRTVALDTETNGQDVRDGRGRLIGISMAWRDTDGMQALYLPFRHMGNNYEYGPFREHLQHIVSNKRLIMQNAKFDLTSLETIGLNTDLTRFYCTIVLAHLIDENNPIGGKGLDTLARYYLGKPGKNKSQEQKIIEKHLGWSGVPPQIMTPYAVQDAVSTFELMEHYQPLLKAENLGNMWEHKEQFTRLVRQMEIAGVNIDQETCHREIDRGEKRMLEIITELDGKVPSKFKDLNELLINRLGLPKMYNVDKKTGEKRQTFDKNAMEEYDIILERSNNPIARRVLEYRGWMKSVSSNYRPYVELLSPDQRLRCNYKLHGTRTGRMSCANPNLQQIPRESTKDWNGKLKSVFIGKPGYSLVEFDYSQLELRLGTAYADEPALKTIFNEGRDVFTEMAESLGMSRQDTKTLVYSIQYGAGVNRVSNVFGVSPVRAKAIIDNYYQTYSHFRAVSNKVQRIVYKHRKAPLWSGRFRHFDYPEKQAYKAFNSVIQGGAADIVEHVMLQVNNLICDDQCRMLLTVHDSVLFEINNDLKDHYTSVIKECMEDVDGATGQEFGVKFAVDHKEWGHAA